MNKQYLNKLPTVFEECGQFFSALGDPYRQKIVLIFEPQEELCVNQIASLFNLSRPAISHHLKILKTAKILLCEKRGKEVYYRINYQFCEKTMMLVQRYISEQVTSDMNEKNVIDFRNEILELQIGS